MMSGSLAEQVDLEVRRSLNELHRLLRRQRGSCILRRRIALLVVGHVEAVDPDQGRHLQAVPGLLRLLVHGPADGLLDHLLETRLAPRALVVALIVVEKTCPLPSERTHATGSRCDPSTRSIKTVRSRSRLRRREVLLPSGERLHALHDGMLALQRTAAELAAARHLHPTADERRERGSGVHRDNDPCRRRQTPPERPPAKGSVNTGSP